MLKGEKKYSQNKNKKIKTDLGEIVKCDIKNFISSIY